MVMGFNHGSLLELMSEIEGLERTIDGRKGGITNKRYRVRTSQGHDLVVRLFGRQTEIFIDRKVEPVQRALIDPKESGHSPSDPIRAGASSLDCGTSSSCLTRPTMCFNRRGVGLQD